jgi:hypothetical protein
MKWDGLGGDVEVDECEVNRLKFVSRDWVGGMGDE